MSQENVETMRAIFEGWATGDFRVGTEHLDPNVVFIVSPDFPEFGVFVGLEGVRKFMNRFLEQWSRLTIEAKHLEAAGDTVLAHLVQHQKGRASGVAGDVSTFMLVTFRGRKIIRIEHLLHRSEAVEALGLSERGMSQENLEAINRLAEAVTRRDIALLMELTDPQVEWRPFSAALREGGAYRGHHGVQQYVRDLDDAWEVWEPKVDQSFAIGDLVLSIGRLRYRGLGSGIETEPAVGWLFKLHQGRVVYVSSVQEPEQVLEDAWRQRFSQQPARTDS